MNLYWLEMFVCYIDALILWELEGGNVRQCFKLLFRLTIIGKYLISIMLIHAVSVSVLYQLTYNRSVTIQVYTVLVCGLFLQHEVLHNKNHIALIDGSIGKKHQITPWKGTDVGGGQGPQHGAILCPPPTSGQRSKAPYSGQRLSRLTPLSSSFPYPMAHLCRI